MSGHEHHASQPKSTGAKGNSGISKNPRKERVSLRRMRDCDPRELISLQVLQSAGLPNSMLSTLRFGRRQVSVHHIAMISGAKCVEYKFANPSVEPSEKFMRRTTALIAASQIADLIQTLDPRWVDHKPGTVEVEALRSAWEIYSQSRSGDLGTENSTETYLKLKDEGIDIRVCWQIASALTSKKIKAGTCESCNRPKLSPHPENTDPDSKWANLPAACPSCAAIAEGRREQKQLAANAQLQNAKSPLKQNGVTLIYAPPVSGSTPGPAGIVPSCDTPAPDLKLVSA